MMNKLMDYDNIVSGLKKNEYRWVIIYNRMLNIKYKSI
jgi:hypothetical protein